MAKRNQNGVHIIVHTDFYNKWFEPARREVEKSLKIPMSQIKFTKMVSEQIKTNSNKNLFLPKKLRGLKFYA